MDILSEIFFKGGVKANLTTDNTLTAALMLNGTQVHQRTLGSMAFASTGDYLKTFSLNLPLIFNPSTVTINTTSTTGNLVLSSQTANTVFAAPDGLNGTPSFRSLALNDIPNLASLYLQNLQQVLTRGNNAGAISITNLPGINSSNRAAITFDQTTHVVKVGDATSIGNSTSIHVDDASKLIRIVADDGLFVLNPSVSDYGRIFYNSSGINFRRKAGEPIYTLDPFFLTANRNYRFPDDSGTLALEGYVNTAVTSAISGTVNNIAKFVAPNKVGDSALTDDGFIIAYPDAFEFSTLPGATEYKIGDVNGVHGQCLLNIQDVNQQFIFSGALTGYIFYDGDIIVDNNSGTGDRLSYFNNLGTLLRSTIDPAQVPQLNVANIWTAKQTFRLTTNQIEIGYDASNYIRTTVNSAGNTTFQAASTSNTFTFDNISIFSRDIYTNTSLHTTGGLRLIGENVATKKVEYITNIDSPNSYLKDNTGVVSLDWNNRVLINFSGGVTASFDDSYFKLFLIKNTIIDSDFTWGRDYNLIEFEALTAPRMLYLDVSLMEPGVVFYVKDIDGCFSPSTFLQIVGTGASTIDGGTVILDQPYASMSFYSDGGEFYILSIKN